MRRLAPVLFVALLISGAARAQFQSLRAADPSQQMRTATDPGFLRYDPGLRPAWAASRFPLVIEQPPPRKVKKSPIRRRRVRRHRHRR